MWQRLVGTDDSLAGLVLRVTLGLVIFPHGAQKLLGWFGGHGLAATVDAFARMGIPKALALMVIAGESAGPILLLTGFLTRFCAFSIGLIMTGAVVLVHYGNGFFMNWTGQQAGEGFEFHLLAIGIALALTIRGGGYASVDLLLTREV